MSAAPTPKSRAVTRFHRALPASTARAVADLIVEMFDPAEAAARIERLEAALREIKQRRDYQLPSAQDIARALGIRHDRAHNQRVMITREYYRLTGGAPGSRG